MFFMKKELHNFGKKNINKKLMNKKPYIFKDLKLLEKKINKFIFDYLDFLFLFIFFVICSHNNQMNLMNYFLIFIHKIKIHIYF